MWLGDTKKGLSFVNKQMTVFTGMSAEKLLGDGWLPAIHPDDLDQARSVYDVEWIAKRTTRSNIGPAAQTARIARCWVPPARAISDANTPAR